MASHTRIEERLDQGEKIERLAQLVETLAQRAKNTQQPMTTAEQALQEARANVAVFAENQAAMQWVTDESGLFHTLAAPDITSSNGTRAKFPFGGKDDFDNVRVLMLRVSHNQLYKLMLANICATKVSRNDKGRTFLLRGPPGTGKSVMLNLIWYVSLFELGMNVICHKGGGVMHMYRDDKKTVSMLTHKWEVLDWMSEPNTVYLFDPNETSTQPVYGDDSRGINVIASSPNLKHYECILKSASSSPKSATIMPVWSYAWTHDEIVAGLNILRKPVTDGVKKASKAVFGDFRFALQAASGLVTEDSATKALSGVIDKITAEHFDMLQRYAHYNVAFADLLCTNGIPGSFQLSHTIVTQQALTTFKAEEPLDLPAVIHECKKTQTKEDATSLLKAWEKSLDATRSFHMEFQLQWAHPRARELLLQRAIAIRSPVKLLRMFKLFPPGADGFADEAHA